MHFDISNPFRRNRVWTGWTALINSVIKRYTHAKMYKFRVTLGLSQGHGWGHFALQCEEYASLYTVSQKAWCRFLRGGEKYFIYFVDNLLLFPTVKEFQNRLTPDEVIAIIRQHVFKTQRILMMCRYESVQRVNSTLWSPKLDLHNVSSSRRKWQYHDLSRCVWLRL